MGMWHAEVGGGHVKDPNRNAAKRMWLQLSSNGEATSSPKVITARAGAMGFRGAAPWILLEGPTGTRSRGIAGIAGSSLLTFPGCQSGCCLF